MYNIIQLNDKNLSELQTIAQELGIKKTDSLKKEELVYKILDEQAIAGATKKVAASKLKKIAVIGPYADKIVQDWLSMRLL